MKRLYMLVKVKIALKLKETDSDPALIIPGLYLGKNY